MKKLIITTLVLLAVTFVACKKDNLQPTTNSITNIETSNDDDKAVDPRAKFLGTWKVVGKTTKYKIQKLGLKDLDIGEIYGTSIYYDVYVKSGSIYKREIPAIREVDGEESPGKITFRLTYKSKKKLMLTETFKDDYSSFQSKKTYTLIKIN